MTKEANDALRAMYRATKGQQDENETVTVRTGRSAREDLTEIIQRGGDVNAVLRDRNDITIVVDRRSEADKWMGNWIRSAARRGVRVDDAGKVIRGED